MGQLAAIAAEAFSPTPPGADDYWMKPWNLTRPTRLLRACVTLAAALTLAAACAPATPPAAAKTPTTRAFSAAIEGVAPYQPAARKCVKTNSYDKPGPIALRSLLLATYGSQVGGLTVFTGITRPCDGTVSEHAEGRALDWGMDYRNLTMRADGKALLSWLFATDQYGNKRAIATRMGLMYVIWNKQIYGVWSDYQPKPYTCGTDPTACHVDHMHFSVDLAGSKAQTSFFTGRVAAGG